jgi:hypothetical protein
MPDMPPIYAEQSPAPISQSNIRERQAQYSSNVGHGYAAHAP